MGRLAHGGWEGELDLVMHLPGSTEVVHLEPSLDAHPWARREERFSKKFEAERKWIPVEIFPWLGATISLRQQAILVSPGRGRTLAGAEVRSVDEVIGEIKGTVGRVGIGAKAAISERYPLLRTVQLVLNGYYRPQ